MEQIEFEHNVPALRSLLRNHAHRYLSEDADINDVVQDTMLKLWQLRIRITDADYMMRLGIVVLRNSSVSLLRQRNKRQFTTIDNISSTVASYHYPQHIEEREDEEWIDECIRSLPDKQRAILEMRNVEQLSYSEIARIIGTTESSIRGLISRARTTLLQKLKNRNQL